MPIAARFPEPRACATDGSCVPLRDQPLLVELYRSGSLRLDPLITACTLDDVNDAFRRMEAGETARSVIVFDA